MHSKLRHAYNYVCSCNKIIIIGGNWGQRKCFPQGFEAFCIKSTNFGWPYQGKRELIAAESSPIYVSVGVIYFWRDYIMHAILRAGVWCIYKRETFAYSTKTWLSLYADDLTTTRNVTQPRVGYESYEGSFIDPNVSWHSQRKFCIISNRQAIICVFWTVEQLLSQERRLRIFWERIDCIFAYIHTYCFHMNILSVY